MEKAPAESTLPWSHDTLEDAPSSSRALPESMVSFRAQREKMQTSIYFLQFRDILAPLEAMLLCLHSNCSFVFFVKGRSNILIVVIGFHRKLVII